MAIVHSVGLSQRKIPMTSSGNRDLPGCSAVPQPTVPPRTTGLKREAV